VTFLATLSQCRLLHAVSSYRVWNATVCLKALQRGENELPLIDILGNQTSGIVGSRKPREVEGIRRAEVVRPRPSLH
jgi:hypothetical protein